jgi:hypothetical protein
MRKITVGLIALSIAVGANIASVASARAATRARAGAVKWVETAQLTGLHRGSDDGYAFVSAISGTIAVVGAVHYGGTDDVVGPGAVYVFSRRRSGWSPMDVLHAPDDSGGFGSSVAIDGSTIVVSGAGGVYVFGRSGPGWTLAQTIVNPKPGPLSSFPGPVAVSGDELIVGVPGVDADEPRAYFFARHDGQWSLQQRIKPAINRDFGWRVAISGDRALIADDLADSQDVTGAGLVYVMRNDSGTWVSEATLHASDPVVESGFGSSVAISGPTVVVGASGSGVLVGEAYEFSLVDGAWVQAPPLVDPGGQEDDYFGDSVGVSGSTAVVGASGWHQEHGAAFVYRRAGASWVRHGTLTPADSKRADNFGDSVAIDGSRFLVGAPNHFVGTVRGTAYVFESQPATATLGATGRTS